LETPLGWETHPREEFSRMRDYSRIGVVPGKEPFQEGSPFEEESHSKMEHHPGNESFQDGRPFMDGSPSRKGAPSKKGDPSRMEPPPERESFQDGRLLYSGMGVLQGREFFQDQRPSGTGAHSECGGGGSQSLGTFPVWRLLQTWDSSGTGAQEPSIRC
jgi:hypothetical protein